MAIITPIALFLQLLGLLGLLFIPSCFEGAGKAVRLVRVIDGDTVVLREVNLGESFRLRLSHIDAPEKDQNSLDGRPLGKEATSFLENYLRGKALYLRPESDKDPYGRTLGVLWAQKISDANLNPILNFNLNSKKEMVSVNLLLVQEGLAFLYPFTRFESLAERRAYLKALETAKKHRSGLWSSRGFLSPYAFRQKKKKLRH